MHLQSAEIRHVALRRWTMMLRKWHAKRIQNTLKYTKNMLNNNFEERQNLKSKFWAVFWTRRGSQHLALPAAGRSRGLRFLRWTTCCRKWLCGRLEHREGFAFRTQSCKGRLQIVTLYLNGGLNTCDEMWQGRRGWIFYQNSVTSFMDGS